MMMDKKPDYSSMGDSGKVRLTLLVSPAVKDALKKQAAEAGVSASAYVSVLAMEREKAATASR